MTNIATPLFLKNTLEIHYWFKDESHSMDAFIHNKCEYELLNILKEVSKIFDCDIIIETEPLAEGGLKRWFKVLAKKENKNGAITAAIILIIVTTILSSVGKLGEKVFDEIFCDKEIIELQKDKTKEEIESIRLENEIKRQEIEKNNAIKKRKSSFYTTLDTLPKIEQVSLVIKNENKDSVSEEIFVNKNEFKNFILATDKLESINVENAIIEIISPVLKKGDYKWRGIYEGAIVSFSMKSNEFKTLVQIGKIEFRNGSSIKCLLEIEQKLDNDGIEQNTAYNILRVDEYFESEKPIETPEGRRYRKKREADKSQLKLFSSGE